MSLTPHERKVAEIVDSIWYDFDTDRNNYLDKKECRRFVEYMNQQSGIENMQTQDFEILFQLFDIDQSGTVEKEEMFIFMMYLTTEG